MADILNEEQEYFWQNFLQFLITGNANGYKILIGKEHLLIKMKLVFIYFYAKMLDQYFKNCVINLKIRHREWFGKLILRIVSTFNNCKIQCDHSSRI